MHRSRIASSVATIAVAISACFAAQAQSPSQGPATASAGAVGLGDRGWYQPDAIRTAVRGIGEASAFQFSFLAGLASDYVYRGTSLSDRKPAVGAAFDASFGAFYAAATMASVNLPTRPSGEITMRGGVRPTIGNVNFDFGATYYLYPGEVTGGATNGIEYWEAGGRFDTAIGELFRIAGGYAYSPNVSNTGAWSQYAAFGLGVDLPKLAVLPNVSASVTGGAGYSWFGNQAAALGGFPLPAYLNWQAGVTFTQKSFNLDLRYYDTNLSKESCYVFTGDPNAQPGGRPNLVTNPGGLMSRWCSAAFVARFWFALN